MEKQIKNVVEKPKMAIVQLSPRENFIGPDEEKPNCETHWLDGNRYDIATDKPVEVPLELAIDMKRSGRIKSYMIVK